MKTKTPSVVFTSILFAGTLAFAQNTTGQQNPYATGQTQTGQENPYATGQTSTKQITGTVTSLSPGKEVTVQTSTGQTHKFSLSSSANTTISPDVTTGSTVIVTESTSPSGQKMVTITPAAPGATGTGASGSGY